MDRNYKGLIWTNHSIERMSARGISQGDAWATWRRPDQSKYGRNKGVWVYYRSWGSQRIEVVAKQNERKRWIILSVWSRGVRERDKASGPKGHSPSHRPFGVGDRPGGKRSFARIILDTLLGKRK